MGTLTVNSLTQTTAKYSKELKVVLTNFDSVCGRLEQGYYNHSSSFLPLFEIFNIVFLNGSLGASFVNS